jgi:hypothetical protein
MAGSISAQSSLATVRTTSISAFSSGITSEPSNRLPLNHSIRSAPK